jgi:hypothetical protein
MMLASALVGAKEDGRRWELSERLKTMLPKLAPADATPVADLLGSAIIRDEDPVGRGFLADNLVLLMPQYRFVSGSSNSH